MAPIPTKQIRSLSERVTKGTTPTSIGRAFTSRGVRFIKVETIAADGHYLPGKEAYIDAETNEILRRSQLREGDILFSIAGALGRTTIVDRRWLPANTNQAFAIIRLSRKAGIDPRYVLWTLRSAAITSRIAEINVQAAQANLSLEQIRDFEIPVPDLDIQRGVVRALDDTNELVVKLERLITKKQAIKQGIMQQLLGDKTRPARYAVDFGRAVNARLSEISEFITKGATPTTYGYRWQDSGVLFLRSECVSPHGLDLRQAMFISEEAHRALRRSQVADGDILMTITGNVGRVVRLHGVGAANINQHIARIRMRDHRFDSSFVYHYLSQKDIREQYESITTGQAYPQISLTQVRNTLITAPSIDIQRKLAQVFDDIDDESASLAKVLTKFKAIRQGMMQQLLSGRTRLPVKGAVA